MPFLDVLLNQYDGTRDTLGIEKGAGAETELQVTLFESISIFKLSITRGWP